LRKCEPYNPLLPGGAPAGAVGSKSFPPLALGNTEVRDGKLPLAVANAVRSITYKPTGMIL